MSSDKLNPAINLDREVFRPDGYQIHG